jgi:hypothetical protein
LIAPGGRTAIVRIHSESTNRFPLLLPVPKGLPANRHGAHQENMITSPRRQGALEKAGNGSQPFDRLQRKRGETIRPMSGCKIPIPELGSSNKPCVTTPDAATA